MPAYFRSTLIDFCQVDPNAILGILANGYTRDGFATQYTAANEAWLIQIEYLKRLAKDLISEIPNSSLWNLLLEYPIPRRAKRIDAVLLADDVIFVMEFKTGENNLCRADYRQVEDYCLDLRDFQERSADRIMVPVLIAPKQVTNLDTPVLTEGEYVQPPITASGPPNARLIANCFVRVHGEQNKPIDPESWDNSPYFPTPTIIEAAQRLYANHNVKEIARSHAGTENLTRTAHAVLRVIEDAQNRRRKAICFITGVPGAGKTLAGLNVVHNRDLHQDRDALGVFLSGNGPLVKVLREALARDRQKRLRGTLKEARRTVSTFLQNVHTFLKEYGVSSTHAPPDHVAVFDEAQRAWDLEQSRDKFGRSESEPGLMLRIMDRHPDWAVIVALIGSGQEINKGEAGLPEWGRALVEQFPYWDVHISQQLAGGDSGFKDQVLFKELPANGQLHLDPDLHLNVCIRSYRAKSLADWVDAVLSGQKVKAQQIRNQMPDYPLALTRSLDTARAWLREKVRGTRRAGILASSGGRRLRPHGIDVTNDIDEASWFLQPPEDVRSSCFLELPATEFGVQGLEVDWAAVCWDADLRWSGSWGFHRFSGTDWLQVKNPTKRRFSLNKYRVLLTRSREGMVIWIPEGSPEDPTRRASFYDGTAEYLLNCGASFVDR